jgi:hypothetical protein
MMKALKLTSLRPAAHLELSLNAALSSLSLLPVRSQKYHTAPQKPATGREWHQHRVEHSQPQPRQNQNPNQNQRRQHPSNPRQGNRQNDSLETRISSLAPVDINADPSKLSITPQAAEVLNRLGIRRPGLQTINHRKLGFGYACRTYHEMHIYHLEHFVQKLDVMLDSWLALYEERTKKEMLWINAAARPWSKEFNASPIVHTRAVKRIKHAFVEALERNGFDKSGREMKKVGGEGRKLYGTVFFRVGDAKELCKVKYTELVDFMEGILKKHMKELLGGGGKKQPQKGAAQDDFRGKERKAPGGYDRPLRDPRSNSAGPRSNSEGDRARDRPQRARPEAGQPRQSPGGSSRDSPERLRRPPPPDRKPWF